MAYGWLVVVACLWLVSGPFCGHSICHTWIRESRVLLLDFE